MGKRRATEAPAVPEGMVRLTDVLAMIRGAAETRGWCADAEAEAARRLGVRFARRNDNCDCSMCTGGEGGPWGAGRSRERFTPADGTPEFIPLERLRAALDEGHDDLNNQVRRRDLEDLWRVLRSNFLPDTAAATEDKVAPAPVKAWTYTFTVTEDELFALMRAEGVRDPQPEVWRTIRRYVMYNSRIPTDFTATPADFMATNPA